MNQIKKLVFATNNPHKLREAREIMAGRLDILSLSDINCHDEIPETADTLEGNALIKARWVHDRYGMDCFADDTGLMVDALGGAPGVYSARYAGEHCSPADNVRKLLGEMEGEENRHARFSTVIALIADGEEHCFEGCVEGNIAETPAGTDGFGYDPVFRADESGKCFAEMSAEDKNAISHRGRAMRKLRDFLGMLMVFVLTLAAALPLSASQWRLHPSFNGEVADIIDTKDHVYFLNYVQTYSPGHSRNGTPMTQILRYDKDEDEFFFLNPQNQLSENIAITAEYDFDRNCLVVAYDTGNIDVINADGSSLNIPGLKLASDRLSKKVNGISFAPDDNACIIATGFGYIVVDLSKGEVSSSRNLQENVTAAARFNGDIFLSTDKALYRGTGKQQSLRDMTEMAGYGNVSKMIPLGNALYILYGGDNDKRVARITPSGSGYSVTALSSAAENGMARNNNRILVTGKEEVRTFDASGRETRIPTLYNDKGAKCSSYDGTTYWFAHGRQGYAAKRTPSAGEREWPIVKDDFLPNAANPFRSTSMAYHPEYGMLVRGHHYNGTHSERIHTPDLICGYRNMEWTPLSTTYRTNMRGLLTYTANGIAVDPNNPDHVYSGSSLNGILRLDLKEPEKSIHMSKPSDNLNGNGQPGFAVVMEDSRPSGWEARTMFTNAVFDTSGNLWIAYSNPVRGYKDDETCTELWYWTPEDRAATTSYTNVRPWHRIQYAELSNSPDFFLYAPKTSANRNIIVFNGGSEKSGFLIIDHKGNPANQAAWQSVVFKESEDQDGAKLTITGVRAMLEDPATGLVWVGHTGGVFTIDLKENLENPGHVRRLKVSRNDGTNLADYLLDGISVNTIVTDGQGRKWFGTSGAGIVCTSADGRTILQSLTTDNSEIPDNVVYTMAYSPATNSLLISTEKGLCEYFLSGSAAGGSDSGIRAYPNPVRPEYYGYVTIDNLPEDAVVKITDAGGNLIKELGYSSAGSCTWDVTNLSHKRVPAGVYLVLASNGPDAEEFSQVSKILVMN